jgi:DNA excision repair protein ERCC-2
MILCVCVNLLDNVCIDALSVTIDRQILEAGSRNLTALNNNVLKAKSHDAQRLQAEYNRLIAGMLSFVLFFVLTQSLLL